MGRRWLGRARAVGLALVVALALGAVACRRDPPPGGPFVFRVGVSLLTKTHPFYEELEAGLRAAAAAHHVELKVQSAEFDTAMQTAQIENFVTQKVDAIVICPVDSSAISGAIRMANEAKIPIFTADIASTEGVIVSHIASDNVMGGALVGAYLAKALGGKGSIGILDQPEVMSVQDRVRGFERAIGEHPDLKIVAKLSGGGARDQSAVATENLLQAHPELDAIFGINDSSALGAVSVLQARGTTRVRVVGFDADAEARRAIRSGAMLADAVQYPTRIGKATIDAVVDHLEGRPVPSIVQIETGLVDKAALEAEPAPAVP